MIRLPSRFLLFLTVIGWIVPALAIGAISDSEKKITAADIAGYQNFGRFVSVSGNYFITTAGGTNRSVYIYEKDGDGWTQMAKLTSLGGATDDYFGSGIAITENYAVVAAPRDSENGAYSGAVYIFQRDGQTWGSPVKLLADDGAERNYFGEAVSISGETVFIGSELNASHGAAYVFERVDGNWIQVAKLISDDIETDDLFGTCVSVNGNLAVVGAQGEDPDGISAAGAAYTFQRIDGEWIQTGKLTASDKRLQNFFGSSAHITENVLVVGAWGAPENGGLGDLNTAGQAYLFEMTENGWIETQRLIVSDQAKRQMLTRGYGVSISGDYVVLGARGDGANGRNSGAAYIFKRGLNGWSEIEKITPSDNAAGDFFGDAVSMSGSDIIIGAFGDDVDNYTNAGSVYIYNVQTTCPGNMNQDDVVDGNDLALFAGQYGQTCDCAGDFDDNGVVDDADLSVIAQNFGQPDCPN